jgi:hypothetical protein
MGPGVARPRERLNAEGPARNPGGAFGKGGRSG